MKIVQFPKNLALDPEELQILVAAYDSALLKFHVPDRALLLKKQLAVVIFDIAILGECDSEAISRQAIQRLTQLRNANPSKKIVELASETNLRYSRC